MNIFIEILPLLLGGLIGTAMPFQAGTPGQRLMWVILGFSGALIANLSSGEGLQFLPIDILLVSISAFAVLKVKQYFVSN